MGRRRLLLDAFCCRGGATRGYQDAGFHVVGVDVEDQPDYCGDDFVRADAPTFIREHGHEFDAIHASPPCQDRIAITAGNRGRTGWTDDHVNLVPATRAALAAVRTVTGAPTVIECGVGPHLRRDLQLCGEMFALAVIRHRDFEIDGADVPQPAHLPHRGRVAGMRHGQWFTGPYFAVYGSGGGKGTVAQWQTAMGIDWTADRRALAEAIPPAYTRHIGEHLARQLDRRAFHIWRARQTTDPVRHALPVGLPKAA